jgi:hypothetical protein
MVNYRCNAVCRHCLYACSPSRHAGYVSKDKIREISRLLIKGQIGSVHIGGGEPFLDFQSLQMVIRDLAEAGITLDYIETNAFWAHNKECEEYLAILNREGVRALCISIDPFHAEYVPWEYPLSLAHSCEKQGMGFFLWKQDFIKILSRLDRKKRHSREEIEAALSPDYLTKMAKAYGIRLGGRAANIEEEYGRPRPVAELLDESPCKDLLSSGHFHVDLEGFFIPPGCTGLRLPLGELLDGTEEGKYPIFETLYSRGITGLYHFARQYGFSESEKGYSSKCNLCFHIREFLGPKGFAELDEDFYVEALKYY